MTRQSLSLETKETKPTSTSHQAELRDWKRDNTALGRQFNAAIENNDLAKLEEVLKLENLTQLFRHMLDKIGMEQAKQQFFLFKQTEPNEGRLKTMIRGNLVNRQTWPLSKSITFTCFELQETFKNQINYSFVEQLDVGGAIRIALVVRKWDVNDLDVIYDILTHRLADQHLKIEIPEHRANTLPDEILNNRLLYVIVKDRLSQKGKNLLEAAIERRNNREARWSDVSDDPIYAAAKMGAWKTAINLCRQFGANNQPQSGVLSAIHTAVMASKWNIADQLVDSITPKTLYGAPPWYLVNAIDMQHPIMLSKLMEKIKDSFIDLKYIMIRNKHTIKDDKQRIRSELDYNLLPIFIIENPEKKDVVIRASNRIIQKELSKTLLAKHVTMVLQYSSIPIDTILQEQDNNILKLFALNLITARAEQILDEYDQKKGSIRKKLPFYTARNTPMEKLQQLVDCVSGDEKAANFKSLKNSLADIKTCVNKNSSQNKPLAETLLYDFFQTAKKVVHDVERFTAPPAARGPST